MIRFRLQDMPFRCGHFLFGCSGTVQLCINTRVECRVDLTTEGLEPYHENLHGLVDASCGFELL